MFENYSLEEENQFYFWKLWIIYYQRKFASQKKLKNVRKLFAEMKQFRESISG